LLVVGRLILTLILLTGSFTLAAVVRQTKIKEQKMPELVLSEFAQKGEEIYKTHILPEIAEEKLKGKLVAIDVDTGKYFIDDTSIKAITRAQREFPDKIFYVKRIGYRAVYRHHGIVKKAAA
jgi:hypothetical protein